MTAAVVAQRLAAVRPSETIAMSARAAALKGQGRDVISLSQGEPDFDTPVNIRRAASAAIEAGKTRYTPVQGILELREAICRKLLVDNSLTYSPDQITVGCGAKQVLFNALFASLDPGDEVVLPAPCWVSYPDMVRLAGGVPVVVDTIPPSFPQSMSPHVVSGERESKASNGFKLQPEQLEAAISPRTKWLLLNSPSNPTGAVYSAEELAALAEVLRRHPQVFVLCDDIYEKLVYAPARFATMAAVAPDLHDRVLLVNGVSKTNAMTGWRLGYGAGPAELIAAMNTIQSQTSSHTSSISQWAAVEAIAGDSSYVADFLQVFQTRRALMVSVLGRAPGLSPIMPDGAFYVFVNCAGVIGRDTPSRGTIQSDMDFAMHLLDNDVAVVPGSGFLASPYIRVSFAAAENDLHRACDRIIRACEALAP